MPAVIDPQRMYVDGLPAIWAPVQWELTEKERAHELEEQARASLLWVLDTPEAILRLLLGETEIERIYEPPPGYDPELQGEWDESLVTFRMKRPIRLEREERQSDSVYLEFDFENRGRWVIEIEPTRVLIERL